MPLQESEFDMSLPSVLSARMMSIPLHERVFDLSMPLQRSGFDLSMPMNELPNHTIGEDGSDSDGSAPLLASFLAGFSVVAVGFIALLAKMRQKHRFQAKERQREREEMQVREGSLC